MDNRNIDIIAIFQQFTQLKRDDKQIKRYDKQIKRDNEQLQQDVDRGLKLVSVRDNAHMPYPYFVHCLLPSHSHSHSHLLLEDASSQSQSQSHHLCLVLSLSSPTLPPKKCRTNSKPTTRPLLWPKLYILHIQYNTRRT